MSKKKKKVLNFKLWQLGGQIRGAGGANFFLGGQDPKN